MTTTTTMTSKTKDRLQCSNFSSVIVFLTIISCVSVIHFKCTDEFWSVFGDIEQEHETDGLHPEQIHLSLGRDESEMMVTWATQSVPLFERHTRPFCDYWPTDDNVMSMKATKRVFGMMTPFEDDGELRRIIAIYRVKLSHLAPHMNYSYRCGLDGYPRSSTTLSREYTFRSHPRGTRWSPRIAVFGDMGLENARALPNLMNDTLNGRYDLLLGLGDWAYDMAFENGTFGDEFMRRVEPMFATVPFQTTPGNHECQYNFSHYENRFTFVNQADGVVRNAMYSFNLGSAHFVVLSTEYYFFLHFFGTHFVQRQAKWLEEDLTIANKERDRRPWIIVVGHRPMYCSEDNVADCDPTANVIRTGRGLGIKKQIAPGYPLEPILYNHGVDLALWGHKHSYERTYPVHDRQVLNGTSQAGNPYRNPRAPVHIISGVAGCVFIPQPFKAQPEAWSAARSLDYSYSRLTLINGTHLAWEHFSVDQQRVIDSIILSKDQPQPLFGLHRSGNRPGPGR